MAARASGGGMGADGSDRVHVTGTLRLCRSIRAPAFPRRAAGRMLPRMNVAFTLARIGYLLAGAAGMAVGLDRWQDADSAAILLLPAGALALAASAWVTSDGMVRGATASIGIVVGALLVATPVFLAASVLAYFGDAPRAALLAAPIPVAVAGAWFMWRMSRRPWDRGPSA